MIRYPGSMRATLLSALCVLALFGAYVLSSTTEGMPMTILEAFAAGVPVISTAVGDIPQMLDQGAAGLLVPPGDPRALAEAMGRLLSDPAERERLAVKVQRPRLPK